MNWLKHIAMLILSISIAAAGFPAIAQPECPMTKMMQMEQEQQTDMHGMKDCNGCNKMAKQEQQKHNEKDGCCDQTGCNIKCPAMSGSISMNLPAIKADLPSVSGQIQRLYPFHR